MPEFYAKIPDLATGFRARTVGHKWLFKTVEEKWHDQWRGAAHGRVNVRVRVAGLHNPSANIEFKLAGTSRFF